MSKRLEKYQIDYMGLLHDVDETIEAAHGITNKESSDAEQ